MLTAIFKHKSSNVGIIALERQARQLNSGPVAKIIFSLWVKVKHPVIRIKDFPIPHQKHCPCGSQALLIAMLQSILF